MLKGALIDPFSNTSKRSYGLQLSVTRLIAATRLILKYLLHLRLLIHIGIYSGHVEVANSYDVTDSQETNNQSSNQDHKRCKYGSGLIPRKPFDIIL